MQKHNELEIPSRNLQRGICKKGYTENITIGYFFNNLRNNLFF